MLGTIILENSKPIYVGQSTNISKRISQHIKSERFRNREILFQKLKTFFGRKEIEEFGCYYFGDLENKFHHHRLFYNHGMKSTDWQSIQDRYNYLLKEAYNYFEEKQSVEWEKSVPSKKPGVYQVYKDNEVIYIGEGINLSGRFVMHTSRTRISVLRRKIATQKLGFNLKTRKQIGYHLSNDNKCSYLSPKEEFEVNNFLLNCKIKLLEVDIGRMELEKILIDSIKPELNTLKSM
ncbi:hypothetical protein PNB82_11470 [Enterococcus faecium]|uniref:hypothetical protein n=1 Tax=Enterococcus TaxID=1350 RepID=UPI000498309A|nr:hypothetical protein [Enterococcus gallinarum]MDB7361932.1 hypothetical protein [Enterococcus faecium]MDB7374870.1 hypothetical protein [Enterococcus faecium]MDB7382906.1 hypothetical protein [Enterococcus faecium]MDB7397865.1 hypothetical protein [Enterococcus faecium]MDB7563114.1 hypothetical protein [Enterococcus faecium]